MQCPSPQPQDPCQHDSVRGLVIGSGGLAAVCGGGCEASFARSSVHVRSIGDLGSWKSDICSTSCQATSATLIVSPPPPFSKNCLHVQPQGLPFNRHLHHPSLHLWLSFCVSCVENSKAWGRYNRELLTGLAGCSHCFRKDTKCPPLGVGWVEAHSLQEEGRMSLKQYNNFLGQAKSS